MFSTIACNIVLPLRPLFQYRGVLSPLSDYNQYTSAKSSLKIAVLEPKLYGCFKVRPPAPPG